MKRKSVRIYRIKMILSQRVTRSIGLAGGSTPGGGARKTDRSGRTRCFAIDVIRFCKILILGLYFFAAFKIFSVSSIKTAQAEVLPVMSSNAQENSQQQSEQVCQILNCHGLDIQCGFAEPLVCDQMYRVGDFCRRFVRCEVKDGQCAVVADDQFEACRDCVKACEEKSAANGLIAIANVSKNWALWNQNKRKDKKP